MRQVQSAGTSFPAEQSRSPESWSTRYRQLPQPTGTRSNSMPRPSQPRGRGSRAREYKKIVFTQCPHCNLAFRVTAADLTRASGRVFCAGCGREFNALEKLTEDPPAVAGGAEDADSLIQTLNELTGEHEIRIEDTGVEWRVIDEDEGDEDPAGDTETPAGEPAIEDEDHGAPEDVERQPVSADDDNGLASSVRWYLDEEVEDEPVEDAEAAPPGTAPQEA